MQVDKRRQCPPKPSGLCLLRVVSIPLGLLLTLRLPDRDRTRWEGRTPESGSRSWREPNMGLAYFEQHRYAEADLQFSRALRILGQWPESTNEAGILKSYAAVLRKSGRKNEARQMELRANAILQKFAAEPREQR